MDKITRYLQNNPQLITAFIVTIAVIVCAAVLGYFIKKYNWLKFTDKWFSKWTTKKNEPMPESKKNNDKKTLFSHETEETTTHSEDDGVNGQTIDETSENQTTRANNDEDENTDEFSSIQQHDDISVIQSDDQLDASALCDDEAQKDSSTESSSKSNFSKMILEAVATGITDEYEEEKNSKPTQPIQNQVDVTEEVIPPTPIQNEPEKAYEGKWRILHHGAVYYAELQNNDDEISLKTENYSAIPDVRRAIKALQRTIKNNNFSVCVSKNGKYFFKLFSQAGRLIYTSKEFDTRQDCIDKINEAKRIAFTAEIVRG